MARIPGRVMLIGLDALEGRWFDQWLAEGRLPNIRRFVEQSLALGVRSDGATLHGSIWPTFALGAGPGHHGIYWWTEWLAEEARYVRNNHGVFHYDPFWQAAAKAGKRVVVVDVPYTPALRERGVWTANGWGLHDEMKAISFPRPLLRAIRRRYGDHPLRADTVQPTNAKGKAAMAAAMRRGTAIRARLVADFAARRDWDLFIATFSETHKAGHYLAEEEELGRGITNQDALASVLEPLDAAWPEIVRRAGDDCDILLFSLHGMVPQADYAGGIAGPLLALVSGNDPETGVRRPDLVRRLRDLLPQDAQDAIWLRLPPAVRNWRFARLTTAAPAAKGALFAVAHDGSIALQANLAGRERDGTLTEAEAAELLRRVEVIAGGMRADDGQAAFGELLRPPDLFPGPRAHRLPDGLLLLNPGVTRTAAVHMDDGTVIENTLPAARNGVHTSTGFCYARPGAPAELVRKDADSRDFAPTVLARMGVAAHEGLEGEAFLG